MPDFLLLRLQFFESCKLLWWVQRDLGLYAAGKDIWSSNQHMLIWKKNLQNSVINVHRKYTNKFAFKSLKENLEFRFKLELTMFSHAMKILWSWNCLRRQIYRSWQFSVPQPDRLTSPRHQQNGGRPKQHLDQRLLQLTLHLRFWSTITQSSPKSSNLFPRKVVWKLRWVSAEKRLAWFFRGF